MVYTGIIYINNVNAVHLISILILIMQMSSINLVISEEDNKLKSALSLILHNSFTVAASDILF